MKFLAHCFVICHFLTQLLYNVSESNFYVQSPEAFNPLVSDDLTVIFTSMTFDITPPTHYCILMSSKFVECLATSNLKFTKQSNGWLYSGKSDIPTNCITKGEFCSSVKQLTLSGFRTNSYTIATYKMIEIDKKRKIRYDPSFTLLETLTRSFLPSFEASLKTETAKSLVNVQQIPTKGNMLFLNNLHANSLVMRQKKTVKHSADGKLRIAFYLKEILSHGANNRFIDWICNLHKYSSLHVTLSIITTSEKDVTVYDEFVAEKLTKVCGATIHSFATLTRPEAQGQAQTQAQGPEQQVYQSSLMNDDQDALHRYMNEHVDVVLLVNTFGDAQTDRVVETVAQCSHPPILMIDLSNVEIPTAWIPYIDLILAPSRAVAFYPDTLQHGLPISVIYPPINEDWLYASTCYQYHQAMSRDMPVSANVSTPEQRRIEFVFIGRLDEEKCPSLLLKILRYLLQDEKRVLFQSKVVHLTIIGDGALFIPLQFYAMNFQLTEYVSFLGKLRPMEIQQLLSSIQAQDIYPILINPRLSGETFGYVHIESLFMGMPTIAFHRGSGRESVLVGDLIVLDAITGEEDIAVSNEAEINAMKRMAEAMMNAVREYPVKYPKEIVCGIAMSTLSQFEGNHYQRSLIEVIEFLYK